jgi:hypothetical protein
MKIAPIIKFIGSTRAYLSVLLAFTIETSWLALNSRFPMAFDEAYHFGLIQFFSHHLNPLITTQSGNTFRYGAIIQDPSWLYHYLFSFPYRLTTIFTSSLEIQAISMRFLNIALAIASLFVIRKLLKALNLPDALTNIIILIFAFTPIFSVLSAQINYDNLLILMSTLCVYNCLLFIKKLDAKVFDIQRLLVVLILCMFSSLVVFTFLPIFLAIILLIIWCLFKWRRNRHLLKEAVISLKNVSRKAKIFLLLFGLLGGFLFIRFYGVNLIRYDSPIPQCNQVLTINDCTQYYAWDSNYIARLQHVEHPTKNLNVLIYGTDWLEVSGYELFGAILPFHGPYFIAVPFYTIVVTLLMISGVCLVFKFKIMVKDNKYLLVIAVVSIIYVLSLLARNYHDYLQLGLPKAISGRYLVPVLVYLYVLLGLSVKYVLDGYHWTKNILKPVLAILILFSFIYWGGYRPYIYAIYPKYGRISPTNNYILDKT